MNSKCTNKYDLRDEIRTTILSTEPGIADWARNHKFSRAVVHQSINGHGSREIRGHLAILINRKPSEIWPNRSKKLNLRDDEHYNELLLLKHPDDSEYSMTCTTNPERAKNTNVDHHFFYLKISSINHIPIWKKLNNGEICIHDGSCLGMVIYRTRGWDAVRVSDDLAGNFMLETMINLHEVVNESSAMARHWVENGQRPIQRIR
ncbi:hypothetical protein CCP3SC5AM1_2510002 [Gammaproteobacteria bacterium]